MAYLGYAGFPEHKIAATIISGVLALILGGIAVAGLELAREDRARQSEREFAQVSAQRILEQQPSDTTAIAKLNMAKLDEYYALNKSQARRSFLVSIVAVSVGFVVLTLSILFSGGSKLVSGAISGVLLQFIGGGFFVMYNKSLDQLNLFYGKLVRLQDTMLAVQQCELIQELQERDRVRETLITLLMNRHSFDEKGFSPRTAVRSHDEGSRRKAERTRSSGPPPVAASPVSLPVSPVSVGTKN